MSNFSTLNVSAPASATANVETAIAGRTRLFIDASILVNNGGPSIDVEHVRTINGLPRHIVGCRGHGSAAKSIGADVQGRSRLAQTAAEPLDRRRGGRCRRRLPRP